MTNQEKLDDFIARTQVALTLLQEMGDVELIDAFIFSVSKFRDELIPEVPKWPTKPGA
jgi:hypothetical protein